MSSSSSLESRQNLVLKSLEALIIDDGHTQASSPPSDPEAPATPQLALPHAALPVPSLDALPIEIFLIIVQELDAPTLTCLALANHKLYNAILQHFAIARLHQLCPQYLRSPYLKMLIPKAFNLLIPNHDKVSGVETDWKIQNFVAIPSSTTHVCGIYNDPGLQYMVRCLALVRRYAWIGSLGAYGGIMPDIWQFIKLAKTDESLETQNTWMTNMQHLATTPHVESVELMVLKDLLGEWMSKMHGR